MRLVCEQCSAVYTIEDDLVGDRDFRVSCKQCGTPIVVKHGRDTIPPVGAQGAQVTPFSNGGEAKLSPRPPRPPASYAPTGREEWFLWIEGSQRGPYKAEQVAAFIEGGQIDWATQVWRDGFKDWRAARRDATLVTAVAGARGVAGDTMRLNAARSFLAPEDTIVDTRANIFAPSSQRVSVASSSGGTSTDLLSSTSETQAIDARELPLPPKPEASPSNRPNLRPNPPPAQLNSPENAAFRAGLGLPLDTQAHRAVKPSSKPPRPASGGPAAPGTVGEAFRSAPNLLKSSTGENVSEMPQQPLSGTRESWLPRPQSLLAVAALAFAGGVLAAAVASRYVVRHKEPQTTHMAAAVSEPAPPPAPAPEKKTPPPAPEAVVPPPVAAPPAEAPAPAAPLRELPEPEELRAEVRRVAPDVRRCIIDPALGVDVGVFFTGATGKVRSVEVRTPQISPGRVDCVIHATRQMQLAPFSRAELKLEHKFSW